MLVTVVMIIALFCNRSLGFELPPVPCPEILKYEFDGEKYVGIITVGNVSLGETTVKVDVETPENPEYITRLLLNFDKQRIYDYITRGQPLTYRVDFPLQNVVPRVTDITVNNVRICFDENDRPPRGTTLIEHTLITNCSLSAGAHQPQVITEILMVEPTLRIVPRVLYTHNNGCKHNCTYLRQMLNSSTINVIRIPNNIGSNPIPPTALPTAAPVVKPITEPETMPSGFRNSNYINSVCGTENGFKKLVVNGEIIALSRFPWIVAIYTRNLSAVKFQCGGSLISTRTVVSAAHCFYRGSKIIPSENLLLSLGRHSLYEWQNAVNVGAQEIITHPDYRPYHVDADVAIIQLERRVMFTMLIRPICLWQESLDLSAIEGSLGIIVGWGEDETHTGPIAVPKVVNATIVSELTCIRSDLRLYYITSNRTLCAGNRDGSGPCMGDSGSGLMIRNGNKWMLRGTVSASLLNDVQQCDLETYVVYSDIAKFLDWINSNMLL